MGKADIHCAGWCGAHPVSQTGIRTAFGIFYGDFWQKWVCAQTERPFVSTDVFKKKQTGQMDKCRRWWGNFVTKKRHLTGEIKRFHRAK